MTRLMLTICLVAMMTGSSFAVFAQAELAKMEKQVLTTSQLNGEEYVRSRETLESDYKDKPEYIKHLAETATNWHVRLVAGIVVERIEKKDAIGAFINWKPELSFYDRAQTRRINAVGKAIAERANNVPMYLIEAFWKRNELDPDPAKTKFFKTDPQWAYLANAMGQMKMEVGHFVLEEALKEEFYNGKNNETYPIIWVSVIKTEVARALGEIKSADSVPSLMEVLENDPDAKDRATVYALGALSACVDKNSKAFLSQKLQKTKEDKVKTTVARLLEQIDKSEK